MQHTEKKKKKYSLTQSCKSQRFNLKNESDDDVLLSDYTDYDHLAAVKLWTATFYLLCRISFMTANIPLGLSI